MNKKLFDAKVIAQLGWRQGSIFDPKEGNLEVISTNGEMLAEHELLIILTQSCSVVERELSKEPQVEALAITLLEKYNPRSPEASGKIVRKLQVELSKHSKYKGVECNLNKRFFFSREKLLNFCPQKGFEISSKEVSKLGGWINRYYNRIALPDELVNSMKEGLIEVIDKCICKINPKTERPFHESILILYISWQPEEFNGKPFSLNLCFICEDQSSEELLDEMLLEKLAPFTSRENDKIIIKDLKCRHSGNTFLGEVTAYAQYTHWDFLSDLGELANAPPLTILKK